MQSSALSELTVQDETGQPTRLGDLWSEQTAVLAFVRHFG